MLGRSQNDEEDMMDVIDARVLIVKLLKSHMLKIPSGGGGHLVM